MTEFSTLSLRHQTLTCAFLGPTHDDPSPPALWVGWLFQKLAN